MLTTLTIIGIFFISFDYVYLDSRYVHFQANKFSFCTPTKGSCIQPFTDEQILRRCFK